MWEKIKKWLGLADLNKDGTVTAEDLELAKEIAKKKFREANEEINARVGRVEEEVADVVEAAKEVIDQAEDIVDAVKGGARKGRKKK